MSTASEAVGEDHTALQRSDAWCTALGRSSAHQAGSRFPSPAPHLLHSHCAQVVRRRHLKRACAGNHCGTGSQGGRAGGGGAGVRKLSGRGIGRLAGAVPSRPPPPTHTHTATDGPGARSPAPQCTTQPLPCPLRTPFCALPCPPAPSSIVFLTARSPSRTASLICGQPTGQAGVGTRRPAGQQQQQLRPVPLRQQLRPEPLQQARAPTANSGAPTAPTCTSHARPAEHPPAPTHPWAEVEP